MGCGERAWALPQKNLFLSLKMISLVHFYAVFNRQVTRTIIRSLGTRILRFKLRNEAYKNSAKIIHVLRCILPERNTRSYSLRPRRHELVLTTKRDSRNFFE